MNKPRDAGFTIIELLIATAVFSTILLVCASGVVYVGNLFYKGVTTNAAQEVARSTMEEIKNDFELSGGYYVQLPANGLNYGFCIGSHLYTYQLNKRINSDGTGHALVVRDLAGCDSLLGQKPDDLVSGKDYLNAAIPSTTPWHEFLGPNMQLQPTTLPSNFITNSMPAAPAVRPTGLYITLNITAGENDLLTSGLCNGGAGSQFCASSSLSAYAVRRLR